MIGQITDPIRPFILYAPHVLDLVAVGKFVHLQNSFKAIDTQM
jgi:hypothetical protein